jgi:hypothetical protein
MGEAREVTGLDDFGPDSFRDGLHVYCEAVMHEANLNALGDVAVRANVVGNLANRLRVLDWTRSHPEGAGQSIDAPLFVIGMFRAGTTLLSYLLEQDRQNRALLLWEASDSVPPSTPENHRQGPRVEAARANGQMMDMLNPGLAAVHHEEADGPTECIALMSQEFKSLLWEAIANVPSYGDWLLSADQRSAYEYHRLALGVLQQGGVRGRWTLKSPHHALALEALTEVYPDARLVLLHRDPVVLSASVCSLITTLSGTFTDADHSAYIAAHWTSVLEESVRRIESFRAAHPEHQIIDVHYADLVRDPVGTVADIYGALGEPLGDPARAAMTDYVDAHPKGQFGAHTYDVASFGLNAGELRERFSAYVARYDIPAERSLC